MNLLKLSKNHFDKLYNDDIAEYKYDFEYIIDYICLPIVDSIIMSCTINDNNTITHSPEKYSNNYRIHIDYSFFKENDKGHIEYDKIECKDIKFIQTNELSYPIDKMRHFVWEPVRYFENGYEEPLNNFQGEYEKPLLKYSHFEYFEDGNFYPRSNGEYGDYDFKKFSRKCIDDYKIHLNNLYDATRSIRLNYLYEIIRHFDSPIGHFMIHTNNECFKRYKHRLFEIQTNKNKLSGNELKILEEIETIINKIINIDNIYELSDVCDGQLFDNNTQLDYNYPNKERDYFVNEKLVRFHYFIKHCFIIFRNIITNTDVFDNVNELFRYIFQLYLYMNVPMCVYWANRYNTEYKFIRDEIVERISDNFEKFDTHQKDIMINIYYKLLIMTYKTKIKKNKALKSFAKINNKCIKLNNYMKSKELNE